MAAAYLKNRTLHKALKVEMPFKMLHGEEADLSNLCVIGARTFIHIKDQTTLDAAVWEGKVCGYSDERNPTDVWNPKIAASWRTRKTPSSRHHHTYLPHLQTSLVCKIWCHRCRISTMARWTTTRFHTSTYWGMKNMNHENDSGFSAYPQVQGLVNQTHNLTKNNLLTPTGNFPGAASPVKHLPGIGGVLSQGEYHRRVEVERHPKQGDFRWPPYRLQRERGPLCATTT